MADPPERSVADGPVPAPADAERRRRQGLVMAGLLLTFVGIFLLALLFPVDTGPLLRETPVIAAGLLTLWLGGILMGRAGGGARRRPEV